MHQLRAMKKVGRRAKKAVTPTVHPSIPMQFLHYLTSRGIDVEELYSRTLLDKIHGNGEKGEISEKQFCKMLSPAVEATQDPAVVFDGMMFAGERMFGELISVLSLCVDVYEALGHLIRYNHLTGCLGDFSASIDDDHRLRVSWDPSDPTVSDLHLMEYRIAILSLGIRRGCAVLNMPIDVAFPCRAPAYKKHYEKALGGVIKFKAEKYTVVAPSTKLKGEGLRMEGAPSGDSAQEQTSNPVELHGMLSRFIVDHMASGNINLEHAAKFMCVSGRTLQRWLDRTGIHYQELVDQIRMNHAKELLLDPNVSLSRIAFALGYTAQTNFQNAFRRWMGVSPGEFRERQQGQTPRVRKTRTSKKA